MIQTNQEDQSLNQAFIILRQNYDALLEQLHISYQHQKNVQAQLSAKISSTQKMLQQQSHYYQQVFRDHDKKYKQLQDTCRKLQFQQGQKAKKQIRKYVQSLNEKQIQINNLKKQISSLKAKNVSYQNQINNLNGQKDNLQIFVLKAIDQNKSSIKEALQSLDQIDTDKVIIQSRYRQLTQKINLLQSNIDQIMVKHTTLQHSYNNLKNTYKKSRDQCIQLKFELQKLHLNTSQRQYQIPVLNEFSLKKYIDNISNLSVLVEQRQIFLQQVSQYHELNLYLSQQNKRLNNLCHELQQQIVNLKSKVQNGFADNYILRHQPSLFEYLKSKKQQFSKLQQQIQKIQEYIQQKDDLINSIINQAQNNNHSRQEQTNKYKNQINQLHNQINLINLKNNQLQDIINKAKQNQNFFQKIIKSYKSQLKDLLSQKGKKKKNTKKRCQTCLLPFEKYQKSESCLDCKVLIHDRCQRNHQCASYKVNEVQSVYSQYQEMII